MNKKKIGELDGTPIVTGEKNYANEHEYYMTLNGDNTYQKLEQRTNGDQYRTILDGTGENSGGGNIVFKNLLAIEELSPEQKQLVANAIQAAGLNSKLPGSMFIPVESPLDLPLAVQNPYKKVSGGSVLFLSYVFCEEGEPAGADYIDNNGEHIGFIAIDGGFGSYMNVQLLKLNNK